MVFKRREPERSKIVINNTITENKYSQLPRLLYFKAKWKRYYSKMSKFLKITEIINRI